MRDFPSKLVPVNHVEPVPRRIRAILAGQAVVDTTRALYVWEWSGFPFWYVPRADVRPGVLIDEGTAEETPRGTVRRHGLRVGDVYRPGANASSGGIAVGEKSLALRLTLNSEHATLTEEQIDAAVQAVIHSVSQRVGARLR